jgi:hypothetical protein
MLNLLQKYLAKTALLKASFFAVVFALLASLTACDLGPDPAADGARFNRHFHYYYVQDCRADAFGPYDCGNIHALSPSMTVGLRIDSDGLASLNLDGDRYYYLESEYTEGWDSNYGAYFNFKQDSDELTIYRNGDVMAYWDNNNGLVTYYFYDILD